jgi:hypothetical protein
LRIRHQESACLCAANSNCEGCFTKISPNDTKTVACLCEPQELFLRRGKLQNAGDASQKALLMTRVSFAQKMRLSTVELLAMTIISIMEMRGNMKIMILPGIPLDVQDI